MIAANPCKNETMPAATRRYNSLIPDHPVMKFFYLLSILFLIACNSEISIAEKNRLDSLYILKINDARKSKDNEFVTSPNSPVGAVNTNFHGLPYFEPDPFYRMHYSLKKTTPVDANIMDTKGKKRNYKDAGVIHFEIGAEQYVLHVFLDSGGSEYFIPFKDKTCGKESYVGGRYLDIDTTQTEGILDFNMAYNPHCHYSENYACPIVPPVNFLNIDIKAGEKN